LFVPHDGNSILGDMTKRSDRTRKIGLLSIVIVSLIIGGYLYFPHTTWSQMRNQQSAQRGIGWMLKHNKEMTPRDAVAYLMGIYKVIGDENIAKEIYQVIEIERAKIEQVETLVDPKIEKLDWGRDVAPVAEEIARLQCQGKIVEQEIKTLKEILAEHKQEMFPTDFPDVDKHIAEYDLREIGIETSELFDTPVLNPRKLVVEENGQLSTTDRQWLYGLTHSVIVPTGYFDSYLDPQVYPEQIELLNAVLETKGMTIKQDSTLDIVAQVIVSLKLLRQGDNEVVRTMQSKLVAVQNADGSWGDSEVVSSLKIHETAGSIMALLNFAPQFKPEKVFCY